MNAALIGCNIGVARQLIRLAVTKMGYGPDVRPTFLFRYMLEGRQGFSIGLEAKDFWTWGAGEVGREGTLDFGRMRLEVRREGCQRVP